MDRLSRELIFPEGELPSSVDALARGRLFAKTERAGRCAFLDANDVTCETDFKRRCMAARRVMLHAQIGYRDIDRSRRAWHDIYEAVTRAGGHIDRYGICLDWSMGYPRERRGGMPRGTGLILDDVEQFALLTQEAPVAPHFGDFVIGLPAAVENTCAALAAGATTIGNLGQYFTFRMPGLRDDIGTTIATVEALALLAAQPVEVLVHSNLDDGFAALFHDLACSFGAVLLERYIVEDLIGGRIGHCYGHTFSEPVKRLAFQRALAKVPGTPGTMVYGNTTQFKGSGADNYAPLASYLMIDAVAQLLQPTGHAINPIPVTEAERIPDVDEVIDAHLFANRLLERAQQMTPLMDVSEADRIADQLIEGGRVFKQQVLSGLEERGFDTSDPVELLLALRRIGARRLETLFGPGVQVDAQAGRRTPTITASAISELEWVAEEQIAALDAPALDAIRACCLSVLVVSTDVHEYGKILIEHVLNRLDVNVVDGGVHAEPGAIAAAVRDGGIDCVAISTYNGVALEYIEQLHHAFGNEFIVPVFVGGKLNQIPLNSNTNLPVDVSAEVQQFGVIPCRSVSDMLRSLAETSGSQATGIALAEQ